MNLEDQNTPDFNSKWDIDPDVLAVLRQSAEFSIEDDKRIMALLDLVQESSAELLCEFTNNSVRVEGKKVELLKVDLNQPDDANDGETFIGKVEGDEDALLYVLSASSSDFKKILQIALSGKFDEAKVDLSKPLTAASLLKLASKNLTVRLNLISLPALL